MQADILRSWLLERRTYSNKHEEVVEMKLYYVESADVWVVVGVINNEIVKAVSKKFGTAGLKFVFCDSFEKV